MIGRRPEDDTRDLRREVLNAAEREMDASLPPDGNLESYLDHCECRARHTTDPSPSPARQPGVPVWSAEELTRGGHLAHILLNDAVYLLRITRSHKLLLTKESES